MNDFKSLSALSRNFFRRVSTDLPAPAPTLRREIVPAPAPADVDLLTDRLRPHDGKPAARLCESVLSLFNGLPRHLRSIDPFQIEAPDRPTEGQHGKSFSDFLKNNISSPRRLGKKMSVFLALIPLGQSEKDPGGLSFNQTVDTLKTWAYIQPHG
jgi:hypothetical protein